MYVTKTQGRCVLAAHGDEPGSDEEFGRMLETIKQTHGRHGGARVFVYAAGDGGPDAKQRARLRELADMDLRLAIVSDSRPVRALVTAMSWLLSQPMKSFETQRAGDAVGFLELNDYEYRNLRGLLDEACVEGGFPRLSIHPIDSAS